MNDWKLVWKSILIIVIRYIFLEKETFLKWNYQMNEMCTLFGWIKITTFVAGIIEIKMKENEYYQNTQIILHKINITIHKIRWEVSFANKLHTISDIIRTHFLAKMNLHLLHGISEKKGTHFHWKVCCYLNWRFIEQWYK